MQARSSTVPDPELVAWEDEPASWSPARAAVLMAVIVLAALVVWLAYAVHWLP